MKIKFMLISLLFSTTIAQDNQNAPEVEISNGLLRGVYEKSYNGRDFSSFEGIPYARPPIGELRFEAPREIYNWTGTWIANTKHTCLQTVGSTITGDEDCLYINVYVPRKKPSSSDNLDVIVHIHGGSFAIMSGHYYSGPKYLMDEEVIFVTMNYRLGPFGFLSTQDEVVPGNNGLKDQVLALQWIQKNIKYFGGNPDSVTITGMSAGGISVHLHYFSPLSKGLFHKGVSQSGTALLPGVVGNIALTLATNLAEDVGCPTETSRELLNCLKSRPGIKISETLKFPESDVISPLLYGPVVELKHEGAFLTRHPYDMLLDETVTDVPWIVSVAEKEGTLSMIVLPEPMLRVIENFESLLPYILSYNDMDDADQKSLTEKIKRYYFKNDSPDIAQTVADIFGDRFFVSESVFAARLQAKANKSPVYFYKFGYRGQHGFADLLVPNSEYSIATHGDDIQYYLHTSSAEEKLSKSDEKMKSIFLEWLLNFARTQEPKIEGEDWIRVSGGDELEYLYFKDPENLLAETEEDFGGGSIWKDLRFKDINIDRVFRDEL